MFDPIVYFFSQFSVSVADACNLWAID